MAQFYTLEEAARVLGMSAEELKSKAQHREIRAFLDGGSWRFRVVDIDELARHRGLGSDAELRLSDLEVPAVTGEQNLEDLDLSEFQLGAAKPDLGDETMDISSFSAPAAKMSSAAKPSSDTGSDHDILFDDLSVPPNPVTGSSSVIIGMQTSGKLPSDSDVRLVPDNVKGASDSDVRLASPDPDLKAPSDSDVTLIKDDTADHNFLSPAGGSGDTAVRSSPMVGSSAEVPVAESDSDFELNPSSDLVNVLQPESGSDFELSALDASDEFESTPLRPSDSDVTAAPPDTSGINLSRPSDSGINLMGPGAIDLKHHDSIELAPLSDEEIKTFKSQPAKPAKADGKAAGARPRRARPSPAWPRLRPPLRRRGKKTSSTTQTSRWMSRSRMKTRPTTRPCSSKRPAISTWKIATAGPRCLPSTRKTSTRTRPPRWPRPPSQRRKRKTTASSRPSPARWPQRGRPTKAPRRRGGPGDGHLPRGFTRMGRPLGRSAQLHDRLTPLRLVRLAGPDAKPLRLPGNPARLRIGPGPGRPLRKLRFCTCVHNSGLDRMEQIG